MDEHTDTYFGIVFNFEEDRKNKPLDRWWIQQLQSHFASLEKLK